MIEKNPELEGMVVWGIITSELSLLAQLEDNLHNNFGKIIFRSQVIPFTYTTYYEPEMGKNLQRCWWVTENLKPLEQLADIKNFACSIETKSLNQQGQRRINIDPGFLTLANFILATTKNFSHRIYLKNNIFAEITLIYRNKSYQALDWTYPDYRDAISFFNEVRDNLLKILNAT